MRCDRDYVQGPDVFFVVAFPDGPQRVMLVTDDAAKAADIARRAGLGVVCGVLSMGYF